MVENNVDLIRRLYGFDWAAVGSRRRGLEELAELLEADFVARMSPEFGERELHGLRDFSVFVEGLEADFEEFHYDLEELREAADGRIVVSGTIFGRGRKSKMPLRSSFGHIWTVRGGKALALEAYLDPERAGEAASSA